MKKLSVVIIFVLFVQSCQKRYQVLNGNWSVLETKYQGEIISHNPESIYSSSRPTMVINLSSKYCSLPVKSVALDPVLPSGKVKIEKGDNDIFVIYNAEDDRLNGNYKMNITQYDTIIGNFSTAYYILELNSRNVEIVALKYR